MTRALVGTSWPVLESNIQKFLPKIFALTTLVSRVLKSELSKHSLNNPECGPVIWAMQADQR